MNSMNQETPLKLIFLLVTNLYLLGEIICSTRKYRGHVLRLSASKYCLLFLSLATLFSCNVSPHKEKIIKLAEIKVENPTCDVGPVSNLDTLQVVYTLKNTGCCSWRIDSITTSCECLYVEYVNKELLPGKSTKIVLKLYPETFHGDFMRTAELKGNSSNDVVLTLIGTVL